MKKLIALLLATVMCFSLAACGGKSNTGGGKNAGATTDNKTEQELVVTTKHGELCINGNRFAELVETVELTTENWLEYMQYSAFSYETVEKDAFGDVVSTGTFTYYLIAAKTDKYYQFAGTETNPAAIELKNKTTGEVFIAPFSDEGVSYLLREDGGDLTLTEDFNLADYECTRIQGTLYIVDVPEQVLQDSESTFSDKLFRVYSNGSYYYAHINSLVRSIVEYDIGEILKNCN